MKSGYEFLGSVIGAGILGFFIDQYFQTQPWGMMALIVAGFIGATLRAQRAMKEDTDEEPSEKD